MIAALSAAAARATVDHLALVDEHLADDLFLFQNLPLAHLAAFRRDVALAVFGGARIALLAAAVAAAVWLGAGGFRGLAGPAAVAAALPAALRQRSAELTALHDPDGLLDLFDRANDAAMLLARAAGAAMGATIGRAARLHLGAGRRRFARFGGSRQAGDRKTDGRQQRVYPHVLSP